MVFVAIIALSSANAVEVARDSWVASMHTAMPAYFCQSDQYFRQCFDVTAEQCENVAASATRLCIAKIEAHIPATLTQPTDGTTWGSIIGRCAGQSYELTLTKAKINNVKCNNPNNWR